MKHLEAPHRVLDGFPLGRRVQILQQILSSYFGRRQPKFNCGSPQKTLLEVEFLFVMDACKEQYSGDTVKDISEIGATFGNDERLESLVSSAPSQKGTQDSHS